MPGVVAYVDHTDIPGKNDALLDEETSIEQIFTSGRVFYAGQAIGLILANSFEEAHRSCAFFNPSDSQIVNLWVKPRH